MNTIEELECWMQENNIKNTYTPNARYSTDEGEGLEVLNGIFIWYYIEKGNRSDIEHFKNESEAVRYIYNYLKNHER